MPPPPPSLLLLLPLPPPLLPLPPQRRPLQPVLSAHSDAPLPVQIHRLLEGREVPNLMCGFMDQGSQGWLADIHRRFGACQYVVYTAGGWVRCRVGARPGGCTAGVRVHYWWVAG